MTFTMILILNIVFDVAIIGGLAFVMTRAAKLTPHVPGIPRVRARHERARRARRETRASVLHPATD